MNNVKVLVLSGEGINCERETAMAFRRLGAEADITHIRILKENPSLLEKYQILAFPGGFSYGDELHSGQILAMELKHSIEKELKAFIAKKGLVIGICNGFQILMKLGVFEKAANRSMTLFHNKQFQFQDRWTKCLAPESRCVWTQGVKELHLPIRHGEGRIIAENNINSLFENGQVALTYESDVNGSVSQIAGLCDETGQIFGLMPHPEAALEDWLYPPSLKPTTTSALQLFKNAINYAKDYV